MRRWTKRIGLSAAFLMLAFVLAAGFSMRSGDPLLFPVKPGAVAIPVHVVSHGYHSGLVLRRNDLLHTAVARNNSPMNDILGRFGLFNYLEFGWGDEGFYHDVRTIGDLKITQALRALLKPGNASVMHVVGLYEEPRQNFPLAAIIVLPVSDEGFERLATALDQSFARDEHLNAMEMGVGLYGASLFYRATGTFNLFNVCNHWVARLLAEAGVPSNPFLATMAEGLIFDLEWRAKARDLPRH